MKVLKIGPVKLKRNKPFGSPEGQKLTNAYCSRASKMKQKVYQVPPESLQKNEVIPSTLRNTKRSINSY